LAHAREVPLVARREHLDERRVVSAEAAAGGGQALQIEAGDGARQAIVLEEQIVDQVAQLARVALECADIDARLGVEAARGVLNGLGLGRKALA